MIPLIHPIPLRSSTDWPTYVEDAWLPRAYGTVRIRPIRYDATGLRYFLCDHAIQGLDAIYPPIPFRWWNGPDYEDRPCSFFETDRAEEIQWAFIRARMNSTGSLITNPADIFHDLISLSRSISISEFDAFRLDCQSFGYNCSGVITDGTRTTRDYLQEIADSIGAIWSGNLPGWGRIYPRPTMPAQEPIDCTLDVGNTVIQSVICDSSDYKTELRILYDYDHSSGSPRKSITLRADEPARANLITHEMQMKWISQSDQATQIGTRILQRLARKKWTIRGTAGRKLSAGQWVTVSHPLCPNTENDMLLGTEGNIQSKDTTIQFEQLIGSAPAISQVRASSIF